MDVPDVFSQAFVMEKEGTKFSKSGGWGYALFNYDAASEKCLRLARHLHFPTILPVSSTMQTLVSLSEGRAYS